MGPSVQQQNTCQTIAVFFLFLLSVNAYPDEGFSFFFPFDHHSFHRPAAHSSGLNHLDISRVGCRWRVWHSTSHRRLDELVSYDVSGALLMDICLSLCSRAKELKRAREHESDGKSPLTMWYHSPDSSFLFCFYPRHFSSARWGKQKIPRSLRLLLLQCYWLYYYYYMYNSKHFFTYLFFSLTWFRMESDNSYGIMNYNGYGLGWRGRGVQDICFLAFFALFHGLLCLFWIQREGRQRGRQDMSVEIWRDANRGYSRRSRGG